ncbi:hypothetical protein L1049_004816 [Liquidambar formosana]|uniref:AB hydrolase-1 domain-containing protein n=1 Tax=Liquidambar formosana TaxID=63359 RepID=A0AAP0RQC5_LIQFO
MDSLLMQILPFSLPAIPAVLPYISSGLSKIMATLLEKALSQYFRFCDMSPCTIDLDGHTTMHFWTTNHQQFDKPNLVLVHGYGGHSRWQFFRMVRPLSRSFNLYIPDLVFFGKSNTHRSDRSDVFQARSVGEGLKRLGVGIFSVVGISYGGWVAYRMAEMYREEVEKVVIVSCGICYEEHQKIEHLRKLGRNPMDVLLPQTPDELRFLINLGFYNCDPLKWVPDFFLGVLINNMCKGRRKEKLELIEHLLAKKSEPNLSILFQETLLIWGDQDNIFPLFLAHQLQRHLGPKSKLEIIKDTGHAVNMESPGPLKDLIKSFVLGCSKYDACIN